MFCNLPTESTIIFLILIINSTEIAQNPLWFLIIYFLEIILRILSYHIKASYVAVNIFIFRPSSHIYSTLLLCYLYIT
jgi:hypothetical protein